MPMLSAQTSERSPSRRRRCTLCAIVWTGHIGTTPAGVRIEDSHEPRFQAPYRTDSGPMPRLHRTAAEPQQGC